MAKKLEEQTLCPVCSSPALRPFRKGTFDYEKINREQIKITDSEYGKTWDLSLCADCTHVFANPSPSPEFILSLYSRTEDPEYEEEAPGRSKNFLRILARLEKLRPGKGILFDVGAATGILLHLARQRGWTAQGIEPSGWAVDLAMSKYGLSLLMGSYEEASPPEHSCDAITMIDFIEHTAEPLKALQKAGRHLKDTGVICLVTPDVRSLAARLFKRKWWHFRPGHLGYFSRRSLGVLIGRAGLEILVSRRYSWTFSAHYLLSRKNYLNFLLKSRAAASFLKRIPIKLALADSFEIYAVKKRDS